MVETANKLIKCPNPGNLNVSKLNGHVTLGPDLAWQELAVDPNIQAVRLRCMSKPMHMDLDLDTVLADGGPPTNYSMIMSLLLVVEGAHEKLILRPTYYVGLYIGSLD